ncbi:uncharacterized protein LOC106873939 [Octopus bimaculoides]|uniref:uncharacterized protein LOC106873939 n=1 Tax=Octopus bimaculoides TaxID=37653 RepID=UPI00071DBC32|nr:uncharacterized protein LOC106873939 [Octopus bimaculoides]|eukprot:XP_014776967.1 PREDICTED: uncharacterized protein LOC106873939 [Octopus bimaculoides]
MQKLGINECLVRAVQAMYREAVRKVKVGNEYIKEFSVQAEVHQRLVLSPLLFIIVLLAITKELKTSYIWKFHFADDLILIVESLPELDKKFQVWKQDLESLGLRVNLAKTKVIFGNQTN